MATSLSKLANSGTKANFTNQMAPAIPQRIWNQISDKTRPAICRVVTEEGDAGTGALYNVDAGTEQPTIFAISKHVLSKHSAQKGKTELQFTEVEALKNVMLKEGWIAFSWESEAFDVTIVELTASAVAELKEKNAKSLTINSNQIRVDRSGQPIEFVLWQAILPAFLEARTKFKMENW